MVVEEMGWVARKCKQEGLNIVELGDQETCLRDVEMANGHSESESSE